MTNSKFDNKTILIIVSAVVILAAVATGVFVFSNNAKNNPNVNAQNQMMGGMKGMNGGMDHRNMSAMVTDDKSFIENMIPHHQEAIDTSKLTLQTSQDTELRSFMEKVIVDQTKEIEEMKSWYKEWYGSDYSINTSYAPMMGDLEKYEGAERDKMYIKGMIMHHQGAVEMAQKAIKITQKDEIKTLSQNIITNQTIEIAQLQDWMMSKFDDHSMMKM